MEFAIFVAVLAAIALCAWLIPDPRDSGASMSSNYYGSPNAERYGGQDAAPYFGSSYRNCAAARAGGAGRVRKGEPGYGPHLDADGDGVGCEWN